MTSSLLTGRLAADTNADQVLSGIAEIMGIPNVTIARKMEIGDGKVRVERVVSDGYEVIESPLPTLVTVSHELGELRSIPLRELKSAQNKPVTTWNGQDLRVKPSQNGANQNAQAVYYREGGKM